MIYKGPTTLHFTEGKRYDVVRTIDHPLLGTAAVINNDRGEMALVTPANKTFQPSL